MYSRSRDKFSRHLFSVRTILFIVGISRVSETRFRVLFIRSSSRTQTYRHVSMELLLAVPSDSNTAVFVVMATVVLNPEKNLHASKNFLSFVQVGGCNCVVTDLENLFSTTSVWKLSCKNRVSCNSTRKRETKKKKKKFYREFIVTTLLNLRTRSLHSWFSTYK